jgi:hypothetical protein
MPTVPTVPQMPAAVPASQQMILDAFQSESLVKTLTDVQHTPLYDSVTIAQAGTVNNLTTSFFTNVGPASGKSLALTNCSQSQRLPTGEMISALAFRLRIGESILRADLDSLMNTQALQFWMNKKSYQLGPLWYYAAGGGIWGQSNTNNQSTWTNGIPGREAMHKLAIPIVIESGATFYGELVGVTFNLTATAAGGVGAFLQLVLDGLYARMVN